MSNPWQEIKLEDYERHMKLSSVMQLQALNEMMYDQFYHYNVTSLMILGVAGGNGLNHIKKNAFKKVYGVDINEVYLTECSKRYGELKDVLELIKADLCDETLQLPYADLVVANLVIEYIGYNGFTNVISKMQPTYVSCIIQMNEGQGFVSDSPYLHVFEPIKEVHHEIYIEGLDETMCRMNYKRILRDEMCLPNGKKLVRLDYKRSSY